MNRKKFINAKIKGVGELQEMLVEDGVFKEISSHIEVSDCPVIDLQGKLTLPPYVDPHIHLDYVFTARKQGAKNGTGMLFEGIQRWSETKSDLTVEEIKARAVRAVRKELSHGVQYIRTHADVTDPALTSLKAMLVVVAVITGDLVVAQVVSLLLTLVLYLVTKVMNFTEFWDCFIKGFADMLPIITLIISALTFQQIAADMQMTEFFIQVTEPILSAQLFPMIAFILVALLAFMIANAWGVCSLVAPVLLSMGASVGANPVLIMAVILSGCVFGNHACFYSDTMVLSSQGSGIDNFDHAMFQLPYSLIDVAVSVVGFLIFGFVF